MGGFNSSWNKSGWSGASGDAIGFAGDYPETQAYGFVTDDIHGKNVDPNGKNLAAYNGPQLTSATDVLQDQGFVYEGAQYYDGAYGWNLDNLMYPGHDDDPGTDGHDSSMGPAQHQGRRGPGQAHEQDVFQKNQPSGYGRVFYGDAPLKADLNAWANANTPAPNTRQFPAEAREDQSNWPTPFKSVDVAPWRPVDQSTEHIPMRRIAEDDRPVYRYIAVGPMNTVPTGNQWGVQYQSNVPIKNNTPVPMMPQTPVDPWITQEQSMSDIPDSTDIFGGYSLQ